MAPANVKTSNTKTDSIIRNDEDNLTQEYARFRNERISNVHYQLELNISKDTLDFQGLAHITFHLSKNDQPITLDKKNITIHELLVNKKSFPAKSEKFLITLPSEILSSDNELTIRYTAQTTQTGEGLHRFIDPLDQKTYMYSDLEPFEARRIFPCFDQPDIKATFESKVIVPSPFLVVTTTPQISAVSKGDNTEFTFEKSLPMSTYLFSLFVGDWLVWENTYNNIPLRMLARQSLKDKMDPEWWFDITKKGLAFYESYFGYPYPYKKLDQILAPEYTHGGMENVAAISYGDQYIFRHIPTEDDFRQRAGLVLHEIAHQWFGDVVTTKWWDDLWLNESFASYLAYLAMVKATPHTSAWEEFSLGMKSWAYTTDASLISHPIEGEVNSTNDAMNNFDGITYGKGAAVLQQLAFYIGEEEFQKAMQNYIKKYAYQNATRDDFFAALQEKTSKNLKVWKEKWLQTKGINRITADYQCDNKAITSFSLLQEVADGDNILRPHRTTLALLSLKKGALVVSDTLSVIVEEQHTIVRELFQKPCPDMVFVNYQDQDYIKTKFDEKSWKIIQSHLHTLTDTFLRKSILGTIKQNVHDYQIRPIDALSLMIQQMPQEKDPELVQFLGKSIREYITYLQPDLQNQWYRQAHASSQKWLEKGNPSQDIQKAYYNLWKDSAKSKTELQDLAAMLDKSRFKKLVIDQEMRWKILTHLSAYAYDKTFDLLAKEKEKDNSDVGMKSAKTVQAAWYDAENKQTLWDNFVNAKGDTIPDLRASMNGFLWQNQADVLSPYREKFYTSILNIFETKEQSYSRSFFYSLFPNLCLEEDLKASRDFLDQTYIKPELKQLFLEAHEELERCVKLRKL